MPDITPIGPHSPHPTQATQHTGYNANKLSNTQANVGSLDEEAIVLFDDAEDGIINPDEARQLAQEASEDGLIRNPNAERKLKEHRPSRPSIASAKKKETEATEQAQKIEDKFANLLPDLSRSQLREFAKQLLDDEPKSQEDALRRAMDEFPDVSHQYAALEFAITQFQQKVDSASTESERQKALTQLRYVKGASNQLLAREGSAIRAGLNVSALADATAKEGLGTVQDLRDTYRNTILGNHSIVGMFKSLVSAFANNLSKAIDFVLSAASHDMSCEGPSIEKSKLSDIVSDLYIVQTLAWSFSKIRDILKVIAKEY